MLIDPNDIEKLCEILHRAGEKIVFTNGCFDILHAGHVRYLEKARSFGDCLVLGLNTDASVRGNKGPSRPINSELDRAEVVGALKSVDYVVLFGEKTAETIIARGQDCPELRRPRRIHPDGRRPLDDKRHREDQEDGGMIAL